MTAESLPAELRRAVVRIARTPRLLVASDYDGTLAPIVDDPENARPSSESVGALRALAGLHETTAAVISGRALRDLATLSRLPSEVHLVGSHGSEFDVGFVHAIDERARALLRRLVAELEQITDDERGVMLEIKPASVAVHVRKAPRDVGARVLDAVRTGPASWDGVQVTEGKAVIELAVVATDKGRALDVLRRRVGATAALFLGDDVTDEKAFARLAGPDLGIKVGAGESIAEYRIRDTTDVATVLAFMVEQRQNWLYGGQAPAIERLSMLANERSVALVTPDAKLTWLCHPEADSAAVFADLLGGPTAGHFSIRPQRGGLPLGQRYLPGSMTVETRWSQLLITDYLDHGTEAHRTDVIRVISGAVPAVVEFAPRPEFGGVAVRLARTDDGLQVLGTSEPMVLRAPGVHFEISFDGVHESATAVVRPTDAQPVVLEFRCGTTELAEHPMPESQRRARALAYHAQW
ncbi:MAG: trehalose-phosphatase, partial [Sciscionella sp.]|nr:trehalose-phosphatase [Sciscionella sp.]